MAKKLSLLIAAVAVLAFAVPAMASAAPEATCPSGTRCPVGTEVTGTGTNVELNSNTVGIIKCATLNLNAKITKNTGSEIEASGENVTPSQAGCENNGGKVTVTNVNVTKLFTKTVGSGTVSFTATVDLPAETVCKFTGTNVAGTYTPGGNVLEAKNASGVTSTGCGSAKLTGKFVLEKKGTTSSVILD